MKRFIITFSITLLLVPATFARPRLKQVRPAIPVPVAREQSILARVTVYWARGGRGSDRYTRQHKTSTGLRLRTGHCAVDPRRIPYGSQIIFPDGTRLAAVDTGTAVKNRKAARKLGRSVHERNAVVVDRFFETKRQALAWAKRNPYFMTVKVIPPNSRSLPLPARTQRMAGNFTPVTKSSARVATTTVAKNPLIVATNSTITKNPLNKLGR